MKKSAFWVICFLMVFVSAAAVHSQEGFTGPAGKNAGQYQTITVSQAANLRDDTRVTLTGSIVESLGDENYTFRDSTGDIVIEIDRKIWRGLSVGVSDTVEISGEIDVNRRRVKIEVKSIVKK
jgi:uncharacterized protein (TIGR00156 family)